jgi:hypothetical protein
VQENTMVHTDYRLLKTQKNEILILIKESKLDPMEFEWEEDAKDEDGYVITHFNRLVHKPSGYAAEFGERSLAYSPGSEKPTELEINLDWIGKLSAVRLWLYNLKREIEAPDLWAALSQEQEILNLEPSEAVNTPFTLDEQLQIKTAIEEIRIYITSTYSLEGDSLTKINRKLDYLIDASTRLGRIDWKNLFVGALISLALQQLSPSGPGLRELVGAAGHLLRTVLAGVMSPPLLH